MAGERYVSENTNIYSNEKWLNNIEGFSDYEISDHGRVKNIKKGIWNYMGTSEGDHGTVIGMQCTKRQTLSFYYELTDLIESLPVTD